MVFVSTVFCQGYVVAGEIYLCIDENGQKLYTDRPRQEGCDRLKSSYERDAESVKVKPTEEISRRVEGEYILDKAVLGGYVKLDFMPVSGQGLAPFYEKLTALKEGKLSRVSVFHVGDSHVCSGYYPKRVAEDLQGYFGSAGGTFCLPHAKPKKSTRKQIKRGSGDARDKVAKWARESALLSRKYGANASTLMITKSLYGEEKCGPIAAESNRPRETGLTYFSYGNSGKTFAWYSAQPGFVRQLEQYAPDLVIVTLGTNDAFGKMTYESSWRDVDSFVTVVRSVRPDSAILFTTPPDSYYRHGTSNPNIAVMERVLIDYANSKGFATWDFFSAMGGSGAMNQWLESDLARPDRIHLTAVGYALKGEMLSKAIIDGYNEFLRRKNNPNVEVSPPLE